MRSCLLIVFGASLAACGSSKESNSKQEAPAQAEAEAEAAAPAAAPAAGEKPAALPGPQCDDWAPASLVAEHCGTEIELAEHEILPDDGRQCRRTGGLDTGARLEVQIGKSSRSEWKSTGRQFPAEPTLSEDGRKTRARVGAFPYFITVQTSSLGEAEPVCTDEQALALAAAIAAAVPRGDAPEVPAANPVCAELLTSEDFDEACGQAVTLTASPMEDGKSVYCNRSGSGVYFIVSQHADAATAARAEKVADTGRPGVSVGTHERFLVELKSLESLGTPPPCKPAAVEKLTELVIERLAKR